MMELVGILLPPLIDLANRVIKDQAIRFLVAFLVCAAFGAIIQYVEFGGIFNINDLVESILAVFGASQLSYQPIYKGSDLQKQIRE